MGAITRGAAANFTTGGVILPAGINNASVASISALSQVSSGGAEVLIKTVTASSSANVSFVDGTSGVVLDNTYPVYKFEFINVHPADDRINFLMNMSADGGSNYNVTKTTNCSLTYHAETEFVSTQFEYRADLDLAQSTGEQNIGSGLGNGNDESLSGHMFLFNPSGTTHVKQFMVVTQMLEGQDMSFNSYVGGYANTTSAIDGVRFKMSSGNVDAGIIKLYGIKAS